MSPQKLKKLNTSAAIPLHEEDVASVAGKKTEGGVELDTGRLPSSLMHLAEYYMAVKTFYENPEIKVVLLDKTLSGDVAHLVWSVSEILDTDTCILQGIKTEYDSVSTKWNFLVTNDTVIFLLNRPYRFYGNNKI